ncbi:MAG: toxic anion resistance protein, partial [Clostridiales bacterium]|nr:toxic anion resistance protein [Clostridiales bacterium]
MEENKIPEYTPTLTLSPDSAPNATAMAVAAAEQAASHAVKEDAPVAKLDMSQLSETEQKQVLDFVQSIDITDTNAVLTYGAASQRNIAEFSGNTLNSVRTKDMGDVGGMLSTLVVQLKGFNYGQDEKKGFLGIKKKVLNRIATIKAEYEKAEVNVDKIA